MKREKIKRILSVAAVLAALVTLERKDFFMKSGKIKLIFSVIAVLAVLVVLAGCEGGGGSNLPSFLNSDGLTRIEIINNQTGQKGQASQNLDNINELLNMLHLGDIATNVQQKAPEPTSSAYTITAYQQGHIVWEVRVLSTPTSSRVYIHDALHEANSGFYQLQQPIGSDDLNQFIHKYPIS